MTFTRIAWPTFAVLALCVVGAVLAYDLERIWKRQ